MAHDADADTDEGELDRIREELLRREKKLGLLQRDKASLDQQLQQLSSRAALLSGDVSKMLVVERHRKDLVQKLRVNAKAIDEALREIDRARAHLRSAEAAVAPVVAPVETGE